MPLKVERKGNEKPTNVVRRFSRSMKRSGMLLRAKNRTYYQQPLSDKKKKRAALRREELRQHYQWLKKMGKI